MIKRIEFVALVPSGRVWEQRCEGDRQAPLERNRTTCEVKKAPFEVEYEYSGELKVYAVVHMLDCDNVPWIACHTPSAGGKRGHDKIYNLDIPDHGGGETISFAEEGQVIKRENLDLQEADTNVRWNGEARARPSSPIKLRR